MPKKIADLLPPFQEIIGSIILATIGAGIVIILDLNASNANHNARIERLELDFRECRRIAEANDERWHDCHTRLDTTEVIIEQHERLQELQLKRHEPFN